jgi:ABC-2 type transport system permease protein
MDKLLKIEWLKVKNYTAFKLLLIFFALGVVLVNYAVFAINKNVLAKAGGGKMLALFNPYDFSNTWQSTSYATGYLLVLPAMLIIILITNEYTFRTNRQNVIDGWSRSQFISVKIVMAFLIAVFSTVLVMLTATGFGLLSGSEFSLNQFSHVGFFFLKALTYNMFAVLIAVFVKKTGFAIGLYFIYLGAENFLSQMLDIISLKWKAYNGTDMGSMGDYLPMNAADGLLTFPDNPLKSFTRNILPTDYFWVVICLAVSYLLLFVWWSRKKYIEADL